MIVKGGGVIEQLGEAKTVLLDKTGTLTLGTPEVDDVVALDGLPPDEALRLAASLDQLSTHPLAAALVREAQRRRLDLTFPEQVDETVGKGITGVVEGRRVAVGSPSWLDPARDRRRCEDARPGRRQARRLGRDRRPAARRRARA